MPPLRILCLGEAMVELRPNGDGYASAVSGDTYNTAVYLKRLMGDAAQVDYFTALGSDPLSTEMMARFQAEGLGLQQVKIVPGGTPGLYMINTDLLGERTFTYWRSAAAARTMMQFAGDIPFQSYDLIYFSGISLAILPADDRDRLLDCLSASGARLAFDPNYRPSLWEDVEQAGNYIRQGLCVAHFALSGLDDQNALFGHADAGVAIKFLRCLTSHEWALKAGRAGVWINAEAPVPACDVAHQTDTTAAGDSFNAAYLAHRLTGRSQQQAAQHAVRLAATIIEHPGAIVPTAITQPFVIGA